MEINTFWGDVTDVSPEEEALVCRSISYIGRYLVARFVSGYKSCFVNPYVAYTGLQCCLMYSNPSVRWRPRTVDIQMFERAW